MKLDASGIDQYESSFDPTAYLRQYYSLPKLAADDETLFRNLCGWLRRTGRIYRNALDIGCGPTIHNSFALAPFAERIDLADYLDANLNEIRKWLECRPDAHDWDNLFRGVLECEETGANELENRKRLYRSRVANLLHCDLRSADPIGRSDGYELVTSFFCPECVASSKDEWRAMMTEILRLVRPGGAVFFAAIRDAAHYEVLGKRFESTRIVESDYVDMLRTAGFRSDAIAAEAVPAPDWKDDGFDQILLVHATKDTDE
jgi:hypothetical protein